MNLVIIHYHLNRGGVTSVIRNQINALAGKSPVTDVLILHGEGIQGWPELHQATEDACRLNSLSFEVIPELGYQSGNELDTGLSGILEKACRSRGLDPADTLVQVHNHNLGKNNSLMVAVAKLAETGFRLLLQIHDFAEDMRPDNYVAIKNFCRRNEYRAADLVFPDHPLIHFAFLNHRDFNLVADRYLPSSRCHLLPNPVSVRPRDNESEDDAQESTRTTGLQQVRNTLGCQEDDRLVVYPVRAIRRKNVAEAVLFAVTNKTVRLAVTLPAVSAGERAAYEKIKRFSKELGLPVCFEAGQMGLEFMDLIEAADFIFSSSVAEGFGMVFLESWCWGRHLIGRNLPGITRDFIDAGLSLDHLYEVVRVPWDWIDSESELAQQQKLLTQVLRQFEIESCATLDLNAERKQGWIDFAKLCHQTQLSVIEKVEADDTKKEKLLELNPQFRLPAHDPELVRHNTEVVMEHFTSRAFRERFLEMWNQIFDHSRPAVVRPVERLSQQQLVESFLNPEQFIPLRVENE